VKYRRGKSTFASEWLTAVTNDVEGGLKGTALIKVPFPLAGLRAFIRETFQAYRLSNYVPLAIASQLDLVLAYPENIRYVLRLKDLLSSSSLQYQDPKPTWQRVTIQANPSINFLYVAPGNYNIPDLLTALKTEISDSKNNPSALVLRSVGMTDDFISMLNQLLELVPNITLDLSGNRLTLQALQQIRCQKLYASFTLIELAEISKLEPYNKIVCKYPRSTKPNLCKDVKFFLLFASPTRLPGAKTDVDKMASFLKGKGIPENRLKVEHLSSQPVWDAVVQDILKAVEEKVKVFLMYSGHGRLSGFLGVKGQCSDYSSIDFSALYARFTQSVPLVVIFNCCLGSDLQEGPVEHEFPPCSLFATATLPYSVAFDAHLPGTDSIYNRVLLNQFSQANSEVGLLELFTNAHIDFNRHFPSESGVLVNVNFPPTFKFWE